MDNFLDFINSAELSDLIKLSGIDKAMAERIINARPFESEEDVMSVSGFGEKSLEKLKEAFEKLDQIILVGNQTPARISDKATNATITIKTDMPKDKQPKKESRGFWFYLKRFFQTLIIILFILIIVGGFGYAVYLGIPYFYEKVVKPIEVNTGQISVIATQQAGDLTNMQSEMIILQNSMDELQVQSDANMVSIESHSETIASLESMQADLDAFVLTQGEELSGRLDDQEALFMSTLEYNLMTNRAIQLLSRANLYLSQSNYGLARQDALTAYSLLDGYIEQAPVDKQLFLEMVVDRIEMAIYNLPSYPVIAANDVLIAWQYLVEGEEPVEIVNRPVFNNTYTPTPTPTPYIPVDVTYTPYPPITPSATPIAN
ncbi:MAG: helix-hairpin-helix domain-containing protein [Anaerolineaceae bacterium]|nr:helix-hairpin-helix domain-containing protein [Anaerolineaceae bacterium]